MHMNSLSVTKCTQTDPLPPCLLNQCKGLVICSPKNTGSQRISHLLSKIQGLKGLVICSPKIQGLFQLGCSLVKIEFKTIHELSFCHQIYRLTRS